MLWKDDCKFSLHFSGFDIVKLSYYFSSTYKRTLSENFPIHGVMGWISNGHTSGAGNYKFNGFHILVYGC